MLRCLRSLLFKVFGTEGSEGNEDPWQYDGEGKKISGRKNSGIGCETAIFGGHLKIAIDVTRLSRHTSATF
jgi:hypothetical protein